jgi:hypothetical protein
MMAITQRRGNLEDAKRRRIPDIVLAVIVGARHASPDSGGAAEQADYQTVYSSVYVGVWQKGLRWRIDHPVIGFAYILWAIHEG